MKSKGGFLLLESVMTLAFSTTLLMIIYSLLFMCLNMNKTIEDKVELQQQAAEMTKQIDKVIGDSKGIINISIKGNDYNQFKNVVSIKCKYKDTSTIHDSSIKDKEISLKENLDKLFINTLNIHGESERGGYEIGDYIDNLFISISEDEKYANIRLELSKNKESYNTEFKVYISNLEEEEI